MFEVCISSTKEMVEMGVEGSGVPGEEAKA